MAGLGIYIYFMWMWRGSIEVDKGGWRKVRRQEECGEIKDKRIFYVRFQGKFFCQMKNLEFLYK